MENIKKAEDMNVGKSGGKKDISSGYDTVTGLLSYDNFRARVAEEMAAGQAGSQIIIYSDISNFKYFNHRYGYAAGDCLLREFSAFISEIIKDRSCSYMTRVAADHFIVFLKDEPLERAEEVVERTNQEFARRQMKKYPGVEIRIFSGIYQIERECPGASEAIDAADYARKRVSSRDKYTFKVFDRKMRAIQVQEREIISNMSSALAKDQFKLYMQPKFDLTDYSIIGAEALVRWQREDGTILYPDSFIELYEKNGRVIELDYYMFEQTVAFLDRNRKLGRRLLPVSVNMSAIHLASPDTVRRYEKIMEKYDVSPEFLELELTETAATTDSEAVRKLFARFRNIGIKISVDDFGAGYSQLSTIIDVPADTIKIDRSFVANCMTSDKGLFLIRQVISLVKGLGYRVLCEGIETKEQAEMLRDAGCTSGQGYWFSRPVPAERYEEMLYGRMAEDEDLLPAEKIGQK